MSLAGQSVVIVGGTSGIGLAVARAVLAAGGEARVASSDPAKVEAAVHSLGAGACGFTVNVRDPDGVEAAFAALGGFNHVVFTAGDWGAARRGQLAGRDFAAARALFDVRFWGALAVVKAAAPRLPPAGSITLTNGAIAHRPRPGSAVSTGMAGGIEHLTRGLAVELAPIRVNCVCPGYIRTGVWDSIPAEAREAQLASLTKAHPLPRVGEPDETAQAYLYAMQGGYTTGQVLVVDGGMTLI